MRICFLLLITLLSFRHVNGQLMQGRWTGNFIENGYEYPIRLNFILNSDSTYSVYSYSENTFSVLKQFGGKFITKDTPTVCKVFYQFTPPNKVFLEEIEVVSTPNKIQDCFQKMYLKVKKGKKDIKLAGRWESNCNGRNSTGEISFIKINND